jgi:zinc protease
LAAWLLGALLAVAACSASAWAGGPDWAQAHSDLPADPAVRFGVLPNGLRFAILRNQTPKGQVSIRLRLGVGSLNESDDEQGVAHLLEHMSFRGSTHVPEAEVWEDLQRLGMAVGADASAYTQETQTFYLVDLPNAEPKTIDFGLMRMRETASELTLDPKMLETERGPVLSEERLRDTPDLRVMLDQRDFLYKGLLLPRRMPIGKLDTIQHAQVPLMRAFYQAYYRPDRAALIVVGDVDPVAVEAQIKSHFADWRAVGPPRPDPDLGAPDHRDLAVRVVVDPKVSRSILVGWVSPYDGARDTAAEARRLAIEAIGLNIVNRRFRVMANGAAPPFIEASLMRRNQSHSARITVLSVDDSPLHWRSALRAAEITRRQALTYGVRQDEVDLEVSLFRSRLEASAAGAATRHTPGLAQALMTSVDEDSVFTSPAENLALFNADVKGLTAADVTAALRAAFSGSGPLVFISSPVELQGGEPGMTSAFAQIEAEPVVAPPEEAKIVWPYDHFGAFGKVVERRRIADLDTTMVRFANGVRLTVKPTKFATDQIQVAVSIGHGLLDLPKDRSTARWAADSGAFLYGGLGKLNLEDMERVLASKIFSLGFGTREDHFELSGVTRRADLDTQMQVLTAYATDPGLRPEAFEHVRNLADPMINNQNASPNGVMQRQLPFLLHDSDPRWAPPTHIDVATTRLSDMKQVLAAPLGSGPIEIAIVGDVGVDQAVAAVAKTFGALPPRPSPAAPPAEARTVRFPRFQAAPVIRRHAGRDDQAIFLIAWPVADALGDLQTSRDLRILEQTLKSRLFAQFRVADGAAYEADTALETSQIFPGYGYIYAFAEAPPGKGDLFYDTVAKIVADLRQTQLSADELERARQPRVELFTQARQTNSYWLSALTGAQADPRRIDVLRTTIVALKHVTAANVQRMAQTYLSDDHAWRFEVEPRSQADAPPSLRTGVVQLNCAKTEDNRLTDCRVLRETPPGVGVGATALTLIPNLRVDPKITPLTAEGRVQFDIRVPAPDPGP